MEELKNKIKNMKGITLISLVVTIIVLVILASVSISLIINNAILERAKLAKEQYEEAVNKENEQLEELYSKLLLADSEGTTLENVDMNTLKSLIRQEGNPTGTIIAFYGDTAPTGYLPCDGTERNTSEYPELASFLGASGASSFNLPDLKGEFLRGTGTNSHSNQGSGANVRTHQDGTAIPHIASTASGNSGAYYPGSSSNNPANTDSETGTSIGWGYSTAVNTSDSWAKNNYTLFSTRPTNTSVLYCIKY